MKFFIQKQNIDWKYGEECNNLNQRNQYRFALEARVVERLRKDILITEASK